MRSRRLSALLLGQLDDGTRGAVGLVREGEDESLDIGREEGAHAHRARFDVHEERRVGEPLPTQASCSFAQGEEDGVCGRIVRLLDAIVGAGDHGIRDHGHGRVRALAARLRGPRFGQGLTHEQLVVHLRPMIQAADSAIG